MYCANVGIYCLPYALLQSLFYHVDVNMSSFHMLCYPCCQIQNIQSNQLCGG